MPKSAATWLGPVLIALCSLPPAAPAQPSGRIADRLHAQAVALFRQARFPEAYGRFVALADAGHAPSAAQALWMFRHGATLFGSDWDSSPEQLVAWARLAGQPVPPMAECQSARSPAAVAASPWQR